MSHLDLTPVVEAIARNRWERNAHPDIAWESVPANIKHAVREQVNLADLTAALPAIAQQVREQVAREIEAFEPPDRALVHVPDWREAIEDAARIARGGAS